MKSPSIWVIIGVLALAILAIVVIEIINTPEMPIINNMSDVIRDTKDGINEFKEEVKNEDADKTEAQ